MRKNAFIKVAIVAMLVFLSVSVGMAKKKSDEKLVYTDKNNHFRVCPPEGWEKKEFDDPRSKVEFYVPMAVGANRKASLFFLSHSISTISPTGTVDIPKECKNRVARLKQMGARDARFKMIEFCGEKTAQIDATLPQHRVRMHSMWFTKYGRSYTISFTTPSALYKRYLPMVEKALATFQCIPPKGIEEITKEEQDKILKEKIRVLITSLDDPDFGKDAESSLLRYGDVAIPALTKIEKTGTSIQKERAKRILNKIKRMLPESEEQKKNLERGETNPAEFKLTKGRFTVPDLNLEMAWIADINLWVGKYEVTVGQYKVFAREASYKTATEKAEKVFGGPLARAYSAQGAQLDKEDKRYLLGVSWKNAVPQQTDRHPAQCLCGADAAAFCHWLTNNERKAGRLPPSLEYRLPTVEEWLNFAACNNEKALFPWGDSWPPPEKTANLLDESARKAFGDSLEKHIQDYDDGFVYSGPVGSFQPNTWGLYDVGGNVTELVTASPEGGAAGRVHRMGGSWAEFFIAFCVIHPGVYLTDEFGTVGHLSSGFRIVLAPCAER